MMREIVLYAPESLNGLRRRMNREALRLAAAVAVGALLCIAGLAARLQWLCISGLVLGGWIAYYALDTGLLTLLAEKEFVGKMVRVQPACMDAVWVGTVPEPVYVEGVRAVQIHCRQGESKKIFYLRAEDTLPEIETGAPVRIESVDRFVVKIALLSA